MEEDGWEGLHFLSWEAEQNGGREDLCLVIRVTLVCSVPVRLCSAFLTKERSLETSVARGNRKGEEEECVVRGAGPGALHRPSPRWSLHPSH